MSRHLGIMCCLSAFLALASVGQFLHAQPASDKAANIQKVLDDWGRRRDRFKSVRYVVTGQTEKKDLPAGSKVPAVRPVRFVVLIDLAQGRTLIEHNASGFAESGDRYIPRVNVSAYDGKSQQTNIDRKLNELGSMNHDIGIVKGSLHNCLIHHEIWPLLCAHGIVPTVNKPARTDRLLARHTAEEFESRGEVNHAGSRCLVLRTDPVASTPFLTDEFWIDPTREGAIIRQVYFAGKNPWFRFDTDFQKSKDGWLPTSWTFAHTADRLIEVTRFKIESMEVDLPVTNADFVLPIAVGSIVGVQTFPEAGLGLNPNMPASVTFRVDSAGKWIPLGEKGFTTADGRELPPASPDRRWWWGGVGLVVVVVVATLVVCYRRRIRRLT